jgi:hypothetical protein
MHHKKKISKPLLRPVWKGGKATNIKEKIFNLEAGRLIINCHCLTIPQSPLLHLTPNPSPKREGNYTVLIINVLEYIVTFCIEKES